MANQNQIIYLSPSKLNLFQECPLCFWLHVVKGIHRPVSVSFVLRGMTLRILSNRLKILY